MKTKILIAFFLLFLILTQVSPAIAQSNSDASNRKQKLEVIKGKIEDKLKETREKFASKSAIKKEKLAEVKLKVCETKKTNIIRRSTRLAERAERQMKNFDQKATRVDTFYTNKLVPKGIIVSNYDELQANSEAKRQAVNEATTSAKTTATNFDCSGDDPKGQLTNFRTDMQNAIKSLKEFRTSIKDLIVAVRTAAGSKEASSSATN